jgi:hypothetical protein
MLKTFLRFSASPIFATLLTAGCTGLTLGENNPGTNLGTYVGDGEIAVDPTTETSFAVAAQTSANGTSVTQQALFAVKAGDATAKNVLDLTGKSDPRVLFVSSGVLSMSQVGENQDLSVLDRDTLAVTEHAVAPTWYWGTRQSATRRWVGVADNQNPEHDIHVIDANNLAIHVLPHGGDWLEAMFTNQADRLLAISFDTTHHVARIESWDMNLLASLGFPTAADGKWSGNDIDILLPGLDPDDAFSFTWVGVSPDDRLAVFPVIRRPLLVDPNNPNPPPDYQLVVLDLVTHETRTIDNAKGPVGFTPDGATIVSYDDGGPNGEQLKLFNADTLAIDEEPVQITGGIQYFISHQNNYVVVASSSGDQSLVLYDVNSHTQTKMAGPGVGLTEFVTRPSPEQLWIVQAGTDTKTQAPYGDLYVADLQGGTVTHVPTPFLAQHIGILPKKDELVIGDDSRGVLHFFDPTSRAVVRDVTLSF